MNLEALWTVVFITEEEGTGAGVVIFIVELPRRAGQHG
jgi:hypothetical protein